MTALLEDQEKFRIRVIRLNNFNKSDQFNNIIIKIQQQYKNKK